MSANCLHLESVSAYFFLCESVSAQYSQYQQTTFYVGPYNTTHSVSQCQQTVCYVRFEGYAIMAMNIRLPRYDAVRLAEQAAI